MTAAIGTRFRRSDGEAKVKGETVYGIDYQEPGALSACILRSPVPAGRIRRLDVSRAAATRGVRAIITGDDCANRSGWIIKDQTLMARGAVRYVGEPVAAVAADTAAIAAAALETIELVIDPDPAVLDLEGALTPEAPTIHPEWQSYGIVLPGPRGGNVAYESSLIRGDVDDEFGRDDVVVVEDEYRAPRQHQAYIEPRNAVARYQGGRYIVHSSNQYPFLVRDRVAEFMGVGPSSVQVVATAVGGGFGGKLDASLEPFAALLARRTGRPVRLVNTRQEEFVAATPRENAVVRLRTAVTRDGRLVAQEGVTLLDCGGYAGETPALASIPMLCLPSAYRFDVVRYITKAIYTNTPPTGAFRGVEGTFLVFATEQHLDRIARELGMDRRELRLKNLRQSGDVFPSGQLLEDSAFQDAFDRIEQAVPWSEVSRRRPFRGVGIAATGWLTNAMPGGATLKLTEDGTVGLVTGATEIGTGAVAAGLVQIAAEELGVRPEDVVVHSADTDASPFDAGAQGSRTTFNVGNAVRLAADSVRTQIFETAAELLEAAPADLQLADGHVHVKGSLDRRQSLAAVAATATWTRGPIVGSGRYITPPIPFDAACVTGAFFGVLNACTTHVHLAEVEIDPDTGRVNILRYVVAQDVGKAINPTMIEGQIQGGVAQGIGYALFENVRFADGSPLERDLESYRLPTALDVPTIETILLEHPSAEGPYGVKGVAEPPIIPVAAAIATAICDAIGRPINHLPITPFEVLAALRGGSGSG